MAIFYFYFIVLTIFHPILKSKTTWIVAVTFPFFLLTLPDTGADFSVYESAYENTFFNSDSALFFRASSILTAEPGWFTYTGLVGYIISDFRYFLVFNFLLCLGILVQAGRLLKIDPDAFGLMVILYLPVCFIVIMFWSPRSSLPFALVVLGMAYLQNNKKIVGLVLFAVALTIHSQYAAIVIAASLYFLFRHTPWFANSKFLILSGAGATLVAIVVFRQSFIQLVAFLPTAQFAQAKLGYLDQSKSIFRPTALLSVVVYPMFLLLRFKHLKRRPEFDFILVMVFMSSMLNIAFYDNGHVAGRLSRASDYFLFAYVFCHAALLFSKQLGALLLIPIVVVLPFAFGDLYQVREVFSYLYSS
jgi:EpsG family